ncbi:MerR family DNA-binding protein, partial [Klebsiella pneumoniae]|uniref:MerR family DNA-binding protein n=1 Tax=Klebsiella pneumoniae TaxID=573 RepID=UPI00351CE6FD
MARSQGGFRLYDEASLTRLKWILQMQRLGFTLGQIAELSEKLNRAETAPAAMVEMRRLFEEKLEEVGAQLNELNAL